MALGRRAPAACRCRNVRDGASSRDRVSQRRAGKVQFARTRLPVNGDEVRPFDASADGTRIAYKTMEAGSTQVLKARREIAIRVGDAGAAAWTVNGRALPPMGGPGQVRDVVVTPENVQTIK